jgi:hypothetical protein
VITMTTETTLEDRIGGDLACVGDGVSLCKYFTKVRPDSLEGVSQLGKDTVEVAKYMWENKWYAAYGLYQRSSDLCSKVANVFRGARDYYRRVNGAEKSIELVFTDVGRELQNKYDTKGEFWNKIRAEYDEFIKIMKNSPNSIAKGMTKKYDNSWKGVKDMFNDSKNVISYGWGTFWGMVYGTYTGVADFTHKGHEIIDAGMVPDNETLAYTALSTALLRFGMSFFIGGSLNRMVQKLAVVREERDLKSELTAAANTFAIMGTIWYPIMYTILEANDTSGIAEMMLVDLVSFVPGVGTVVYFARNRMNMDTEREI